MRWDYAIGINMQYRRCFNWDDKEGACNIQITKHYQPISQNTQGADMKTIPKKNIPPPGDMLDFTMENRGATQRSLVQGTGLPPACVESILANERPITQEVADRLERGAVLRSVLRLLA